MSYVNGVRDERTVGIWSIDDRPAGANGYIPEAWLHMEKGVCRWCRKPARTPRATWCAIDGDSFGPGTCYTLLFAWWWSASAIRRAIFLRDDFTCQKCGLRETTTVAGREVPSFANLHMDHIFPIAAGGKTTWANLRTLCASCNLRKGARIEGAELPLLATQSEAVCA